MMESAAARPELVAWETPDFEDVGCAAEVTMYVAQMED
ncbi:pyrroloquinoline quinone precursor peptide PqqA [Saccharopolyspora hirsuta]